MLAVAQEMVQYRNVYSGHFIPAWCFMIKLET